MFQRKNRPVQNSANQAVNKILTYGLIFFIVYAVYNSNNKPAAINNTPALPANSTQIDWGNSALVKNLVTGKSEFYRLDDNSQLTLTISRDDLESALDKESGNDLRLYEIEFQPKSGNLNLNPATAKK